MTIAVVKWFHRSKGFGFVVPADGSPDALLHGSVVNRAGYTHLPEGTVITCKIVDGTKGPQVEALFSVEEKSPVVPKETVRGVVKWFSPEKGFGFVRTDDGRPDIFLHAKIVERAGIRVLKGGEPVQVVTRMGQKGLQADSIELL